MSFWRFVLRSTLAAHFVADGFRAIVDPGRLVPQAEPLAVKVSEFANDALPTQWARRVPTDTETLVRVHAGVQIAGALMMATGVGRRLGAGLLGLAYLPKVLASLPRSTSADNHAFLRELALFSGVLIEAGDNQGKPSLTWLASAQGRRVKRASTKARGQITDAIDTGMKNAKKRVVTASDTTKKELRAASQAMSQQVKVGARTARRQVEALRDALSTAGQ